MKAIYPGSFDPITFGHMDVINRCLDKFDHLIIAVLNNQMKKQLFTVDERIKLIQDNYNNDSRVQIVSFNGLLVNFCREQKVDLVVRGIRNIQDFEFESQLARLNRSLYPNLDTFFLFAEGDFSFVSSSFIKDIASFYGDVSNFVPKNVQNELENKYRRVDNGCK